MQNSMLELEQSIEPSSWSLLTISDCNLCALLSMVQTSESTKALLIQLTGALNQNVQRAFTLEEAIEMNNYGLPEDMYKDTRSRKMKICTNTTASTCVNTAAGNKKKSMESTLQAAMSNLYSHNTQTQGDSSSTRSTKITVENGGIACTTGDPKSVVPTTDSNCTAGGLTSNVASMAIGSAQRAEVLNVLSKSPHIIVCYPKQGSASYIVTVPASSTSSQMGTQVPGRRILPSLGGTGAEGSSSISSKMVSGLFTKSSEKGKMSSRKLDKSIGGRSHKNGSKLSAEVKMDYDAEKFSQFANILVNMDGIGGLQSAEDAKKNTTVDFSYHCQEQPSRTQLLSSSGSDVDLTDRLESNSSAMHRIDTTVQNRQDELMDFASIVNNAVSFNSEAEEKGPSPMLSLPPEVPMSWLETTTCTTNSPQVLPKSPAIAAASSFINTTASSCGVSAVDSADVVSDTLCTPEKPLSVPSSTSTTTATTTITTTLESKLPSEPRLWNSDENDGSLGDLEPAGATQVQVEVIDQPMADVEPLDDSLSTSHDLLDVSLDLDPETLQQLLMFSGSPESHLSCAGQQSQHRVYADAAAPLSPISQLFDRLEPPVITSPEDASLTDSHMPSATLATTQGNLSLTESHMQATTQEHIVDNQDHPQIALDGNLESQCPLAHESQNVGASVGQSNIEFPATRLGDGSGVVTGSWAPSPNSLQLWLESTAVGKLHCITDCYKCKKRFEV